MINNPVYLDNNATTQTDERVLAEMLPFFKQYYGNPSSKYYPQAEIAKKAVETSRIQCAKLIGTKPQEIIFTSGATESNNLAIKGYCLANSTKGKQIITSLIEHRSVLDPIKELEMCGFNVTYLEPDHYGKISVEKIEKAISSNTIFVTIMFANNELGTINPINKISEVCKKENVVFHCDATQAVGKISVNLKKTPVDMLSFSGHKIYGPKGVGALYIRKKLPKIKLLPLIRGGEHENGLRSGTLNSPCVVGLGAACELAGKLMFEDIKRIHTLSEKLVKNLNLLGGITFNNHPSERLPGTLNLSIDGVNAELLLSRISDRVALSSGSACSSSKTEPSHVLKGIGLTDSMAKSTIRVSIGRFNTEDEIDFACKVLIQEIKQLRNLL